MVLFILQSSWDQVSPEATFLLSFSSLPYPAPLPPFQVSSRTPPKSHQHDNPMSDSASREHDLRQDVYLLKIPDLLNPYFLRLLVLEILCPLKII